MKAGFIFITVLVIGAMLLAGCALSEAPTGDQPTPSPAQPPVPTTQPSIPGPSTGTIKVLVTDAPKHDVSRVELTISQVEVHKAGGDGESGKWMTLDVQEETFNLLDLQNGLTMLLADGEMEAGTYTQLRMTVFDVIVDYDDVVGKQAEIPSGKLKFVRPFTLEAGGTITLIVDIDAAKSVVITGGTKQDKAKVLFKPVVKLQVIHEEGSGPPAPSATFEPTNGPVGTMITVTGTGWVADDEIESVTVGGTATEDYDLTVDGDGNLSGTITVPAGLSSGTYSIVITGEESSEQTFTDAFMVTASATFEPTNGPVGTEITVTGTGWVADDEIESVTVGGTATEDYDLTVDGDGNLSGTITVPAGLSSGTYSIVITGEESSEQTFTDAFTVT